MCYSATGTLMWKTAVSASSAGPRFADVNNDDLIDVVIATEDGWGCTCICASNKDI